MKVRIYKSAKSATQSGKAHQKWCIDFIDEKNIRHLNPLMNWISVDNTSSQLHFQFANKEDAIKFAQEKNFEYMVEEPQTSIFKKKSYVDNFL